MGRQHRPIHTRIVALTALDRLRAVMLQNVIFQMVFVFGDERAFRTQQHLLRLYMYFDMLPKTEFSVANEIALLASVLFDFPVRIHFRLSNIFIEIIVYGP